MAVVISTVSTMSEQEPRNGQDRRDVGNSVHVRQAIFLTRFNKIATQGAPQMAVDKEANSLSRVYSYYSKFNLRLFYV